MASITRYIRASNKASLLVCCMMLLLSACQSQNTQSAGVSMSPPAALLQTRAIDKSKLSVLVTVGSTTIPMTSDGNNNWSGSIDVVANQSHTLTVVWSELYNGLDLPLARWSEPVEVSAEAKSVTLTNADYDFSMDLDEDGVANITERERNTDPFDKNDGAGQDTDGNTTAGTTTDGTTTSGTTTDGTTTTGTTTTGTTTSGTTTSGTTTSGTTTSGTTTDGTTTSGTTTDGTTTTGTTTDGTTTTGTTTSGTTTGGTQATVIIPRIDSGAAPLIDGSNVQVDGAGALSAEWTAAIQQDEQDVNLMIDNLMIDIDADSADGAALRRWAAMHDGTYLYLVVLVDDRGLRSSDSSDHWQDDSLEVFIDGDNGKQSSWGDDDDFRLIIPLLEQNTSDPNTSSTGRSSYGSDSATTLAFDFVTGPGAGPRGIQEARWEQDVYEIRINLVSAGITIGQPFGFELQINDDDDNEARDSKWGWFHPSGSNGVAGDETIRDPSIMGTVQLAN